MGTVHVSLQGADRFLRANGDYGSVELGELTPEELLHVLRTLLPQEPPPGDDVCPIGVNVRGPAGDSDFVVDTGVVKEGDLQYAPEKAVEKAFGVLPRADAARRPAGFAPAAAPAVPPTDRGLDPSRVDTGPRAPQASFRIWEGEGGRVLFWLSLAFSLPAALALVAAAAEGEGGLAGAMVLFLLLLGGGMVLGRRIGRPACRIGYDPATNSLWVEVRGRIGHVPDANCIRSARLGERTERVKMRVKPGSAHTVTGTKTVYCLEVETASGTWSRVPRLPIGMSRGDGNAALAAANSVLGRR